VGQISLLCCAGCGGPSSPAPKSKAPLVEGPIITGPVGRSKAPARELTLPDESPPDSAVEPAPPHEEPATNASAASQELLHDSFADVTGTIHWNHDGVKSYEGPRGERTVYFFHGMPEGGPLVMRTVEDNVTPGPDGQPGVLSLAWLQIPPQLRYSGFAYLGGSASADRLVLPLLKEARTTDDLGKFRLSFRHRAINEHREGPFELTIGCRLEPLLADPYAKRIDLGNLAITGEWGHFDMTLGDGTNAEAFLTAIAGESPSSFKIIWSQAGPLTGYSSGDTLLIDDVIIQHLAAE
jgi:hypothetical protein